MSPASATRRLACDTKRVQRAQRARHLAADGDARARPPSSTSSPRGHGASLRAMYDGNLGFSYIHTVFILCIAYLAVQRTSGAE